MTSTSNRQAEGPEARFARLSSEEVYWRDRQGFLESRGYALRPRYRPDWSPSWRGKPRGAVFTAEDGYSLPFRTSVIDATRVSDGKLVYIKRISSDSQELRILSFLSSEDMRRDPRNHCVPILDVLQDPSEPETSYIVMPFLRYIRSPEFQLIDDILEFLDQALQGLVFIHDQGVAHRDCAYKNIMMDASAMYPHGFHPIVKTLLPDVSGPAPVVSRTFVPVQYYYIDFGISTWFTDSDAPRLVVGTLGLDREPPELSDTVPYDPFKLDVFLIGNLIRRELHANYSNLTMIEPLMSKMIERDPEKRPTAAEAYRDFKTIRRGMSNLTKYRLLQLHIFAELSTEERAWRDRCEHLEARGYLLRPRFRPDWVPSWRGKPRVAVLDAEDAWALPFRTSVTDATRKSDGALLYLKSIRTDSEEFRILSYFSSDELRRDPRNHCVPLLDVFQDPLDAGRSIIVMPFLRYINDPPFETIDDVLEAIDQILEGLVFIHDHGVAHRDCAFRNVLMDASALFPEGFHPAAEWLSPDGSKPVTVLSRAAAPVRYYIIDFGISTWFTSDAPRLVVGTDGLDQEPPELSKTTPYDPFSLDVFLIGNIIRRRIYEVYSNLSMLEPLVDRMVDPDPRKRPTAAEAHRDFKAIRRSVSVFHKYWFLQPRNSFLVVKAFRTVYSFVSGLPVLSSLRLGS
ncbi:hypothetical protein FKP32DRAFT_1572053 [Trametes sanguinea]|nr:hypothetical protein FKP32DRAFT_1572053 [Trametes sanguinea]